MVFSNERKKYLPNIMININTFREVLYQLDDTNNTDDSYLCTHIIIQLQFFTSYW